ncbi:hypothetical protein [Nocardiopsis potens]|uniref:hypothetical protein n=1 Tax=Nocardiopsis potens TaxID=1246458 RepID=UPI000377F6F6|nr:hypothetical protein [Nocardiopsis potens]
MRIPGSADRPAEPQGREAARHGYLRMRDALRALAIERSAEAERARHGRIADRHLDRWGGLDAGLPLLAAEPERGDEDGGYGLRNTVRHLAAAGRDRDVHRLLACERPADHRPGAVNVWFDARDRAGDVEGYLADLRTARALAAAAAPAGGRPAPGLGLEMRYALMGICAARAAGPRFGESEEFPALLLEAGIWDGVRALSRARARDRPGERCRALLALLPHLPAADRAAVAEEAMDQALVVGGPREDLVAEVAPLLPAEAWHRLFDRVEVEYADGYGCHEVLRDLAPHMPEEAAGRALAVAAARPPDIERALALDGVVPYLPPEAALDAVPAARALGDPRYRADALTALAPRLPAQDRAAVLTEARAAVALLDPAAEYEGSVRLRWTALIPLLSAAERPDALAEAGAGEEPPGRAELWADTAAAVPAAERGPLLPGALEAARAVPDPFDRTRALHAVASLLPPESRAPVLAEAPAAARAVADPCDRVRMLLSQAEAVPEAERAGAAGEALSLARGLTDADDRAEMLIGAAGLLPPEERPAPLAEAVRAARTVADEDRRYTLLLDAAGLLTGAERRDALAGALELALEHVGHQNFFAYSLLDDLAPVLPEDLMVRVLEEVEEDGRPGYLARVVTGRAGHLSGASLEAGLAAVRRLPEGRDGQRAAALTALSDRLDGERRVRVLEEALAAARAAGADPAGILARLPADAGRRRRLLAEQLSRPRPVFFFYHSPGEAFAQVAPYLDAGERPPGTPWAASGAPEPVAFADAPMPHGICHEEQAHAELGRAQRDRKRGAPDHVVLGRVRAALDRYSTGDAPGSPVLLGAARELGGPAAGREYLAALRDVYRWWP